MNYIDILGRRYPNVHVSCNSDPSVYNNIRWESGDPLPVEDQLQMAGLDILREDIWEAIKKERDRREQETGIPVGNHWFHSDSDSKIKQLGLVKLADLGKMPADLPWKTMDGSFVIMTDQLAYQVFAGAVLMSTKIFACAERHRAAMLAQADPTLYDYSTGWPQTFVEYKTNQ